MTHPFHPWYGREFEFVAMRQTWAEKRVFFLAEEARRSRCRPAGLTPVFVTVAAGRSPFRVEDLVALADLITRVGHLGHQRSGVREIPP